MLPLVSIIIPCYNSQQWICESINSALSQTYFPIEIIVVDDGSTDSSIEILKSYGDKIIWETGENRGVSCARNRGFALSKGKYIQWLDSDDYILPEKIERQVEFLEKTKCDIVYGDWQNQCHQQNGEVLLGELKLNQKTDNILEYILRYNYLHLMVGLIHRKVIQTIGGLDESLSIAEDYDFWVRASLAGFKFGYQQGCYSFYRIYVSNSLSRGMSNQTYCQYYELFLSKTIKALIDNNKWTETNQKIIAKNYFFLAKKYAMSKDFQLANESIDKMNKTFKNFSPDGNSTYEQIYKWFGWPIALFLLSLGY